MKLKSLDLLKYYGSTAITAVRNAFFIEKIPNVPGFLDVTMCSVF